jgi:hypothetical protein
MSYSDLGFILHGDAYACADASGKIVQYDGRFVDHITAEGIGNGCH